VKTFPPRFREGVQHFNAGRYFEAHEAFEEVLDEVEEDARWDFVLALVQVAVGYHKWTSGHPGAARMLGLGAEKLTTFPPDAWGVDVQGLRRQIGDAVAAIERGGSCDAPPRILPAR
jgi:predicted metal-dependent hydrolase